MITFITFIIVIGVLMLIVIGIKKLVDKMNGKGLDIEPKIQVWQMKILGGHLWRAFAFYTSTYLLVVVLKRNAGIETLQLEIFSMLTFFIYLICSVASFLQLTSIMFRDDELFEKRIAESREEDDYMKRTLKKFESTGGEEIEKRIQLLRLYEETQKLYRQGVKLDDIEFSKQKSNEFAKRIRNL